LNRSLLLTTARSHFLVVAAAVLSFTPSAYAHAIIISATPTSNGVLNGPDVDVDLRFNSRIDQRRSRLILVLPSGEQRKLTIDEKSAPDSLLSKAKQLNAGAYILRWQVLAEDGHITRGEVPFRVR
jgi:copper resistance protein C